MHSLTRRLFTLLGLAAFAPLAQAETPLIQKEDHAGFVMADFVVSQTCSIYTNRMELERHVGPIVQRTTTPHSLDLAKMRSLIRGASARAVVPFRFQVTDIPEAIGYAFLANGTKIMLQGYSDQGFGANPTPEAATLRFYLEQMCGGLKFRTDEER